MKISNTPTTKGDLNIIRLLFDETEEQLLFEKIGRGRGKRYAVLLMRGAPANSIAIIPLGTGIEGGSTVHDYIDGSRILQQATFDARRSETSMPPFGRTPMALHDVIDHNAPYEVSLRLPAVLNPYMPRKRKEALDAVVDMDAGDDSYSRPEDEAEHDRAITPPEPASPLKPLVDLIEAAHPSIATHVEAVNRAVLAEPGRYRLSIDDDGFLAVDVVQRFGGRPR